MSPPLVQRIREHATAATAQRGRDEGGLRLLHLRDITERSAQTLTLDRALIIVVLQGCKLVAFPDGARAVDPGGILLANARQRVTLTHVPVDGAYEVIVLQASAQLLQRATPVGTDPLQALWSTPAHAAPLQAVAHLLEAVAAPHWHPDVLTWRLSELIGTLSLLRQGRLEGAAATHSWRQRDLVAGVRSLVRSDPSQGWTAARISRTLGTSPATLKRHLARAELTLDRVVWAERLFLAQALLDDPSLNVGQVARHCGYRSASKFSMRFRAHVGCTPSQWRSAKPPPPHLDIPCP